MIPNRKRAPLACNFCRNRKRRCDGTRPSCRRCINLDIECQYDGPPSNLPEAFEDDREIPNRLAEIEKLLKTQAQKISVPCSSASHVQSETSPQSYISCPVPEPKSNVQGSFTSWSWTDDSTLSHLPPLTIPDSHKTSSSYLLTLPCVKVLIGDHPDDFFFSLEASTELPPDMSFDRAWQGPQTSLSIQREVADECVSAFFSMVHPHNPILVRDHFEEIYSQFLETGPDSSISSSLCMIVIALGCVAQSSLDSTDFVTDPPGMQYVQYAIPSIIAMSSWSFSYSPLLTQALVLASIYFAYIVRPLHSWRLINSACTILQFKFTGTHIDQSDPAETILRLFWSCVLVECDRLAELKLPQSKLQQLTDQSDLPSCHELNLMQSTCYLAEISIRRLLNRIHNSLYPGKQNFTNPYHIPLVTQEDFSFPEICSMMTVCDELHTQLETWHTSIPEAFRPTLDIEYFPNIMSNEREAILRTRYFAARHIIYRPFVLCIVSQSANQPSKDILNKANMCLESCRSYLYSTKQILAKPSHNTWTFSLSCFSCTVVLTLASLNPSLSHFVLDIDDLQALAIENIGPWAYSSPSIETAVDIIEIMRTKRRILSRDSCVARYMT